MSVVYHHFRYPLLLSDKLLAKILGVALALMILAGLLLGLSPEPVFGQEDIQAPEVEAELMRQVQTDETVGYMIYFREKVDLSPAYNMDWDARGEYVVQTLQANAQRSQAEVVKYLAAQKADYQAFWIDNVIIVNSSNQRTFNGLMGFSEIESLRTRRTMQLIEPMIDENATQAVLAVEPNLTQVMAPDVWGLGITGSGMVVANIDTGVRYTHETLVAQYRGTTTGSHDYNWLGPANGDLVPADDDGHGTHTMGTMVGEDATQTNQIGMAPDAQWIACDGCSATGGCPDTALLTCAQWVAAPYPVGDPGSPDAAMRPHVVNNSWGDCGTSYDNWYQASVDAWHAAGIYPIFSNGNASNCFYSEPPGLNTVGNPARYGNVTGVGSTGQSDGVYATHSNWGPTDNLDTVNPVAGWADLKPQVLAPGVNIRSSLNGSDTDYVSWGGTSMSAPHVSGLIVLMWQAAPCLVGDYAATETIIEETATPIPYDDGTGGGATVPNHATGWGEIDALAAVQAAQTVCGGGALTGTVTDDTTTAPLEGVLIHSESISYTFESTTDVMGVYSQAMVTDTYDVSASLYGYLPEVVSGVSIVGGVTTTLDFALTPAAVYTVSGTVIDAATGWPLYASLDIDAYPGDPIWTDPVTGYYELMLAGGITYTFGVAAWVPGYDPASVEVAPLTGDATVDIALDADATTCSAPGYTWDISGLFETFDDITTPAGWTVVNGGGDCDWTFDDPGGLGNLTGGSGNFAIADSDACGSGAVMTTTLLSPIGDVSSLGTVGLEFSYDYNNLSITEVAAVDISSDGGSTWTNLVSWNTDQRGPATYTQDVTAWVGGSTQAQLRFYYVAPGWDWWWQVDDVLLGTATCVAPTGGLVVGNVYNNNTMDALNGAMLDNEAGYMAEAVATPLDNNVDDGFYTLYAPAGSQTLTATIGTAGYGPDIAVVDAMAGDTVAQDFYLPSPDISVDPTAFDVVVAEGYSLTLPLDLINAGGFATDFEIKEVNGGKSILRNTVISTDKTPVEIVRLNNGTVDCAAYENSIHAEVAEVAAACSSSVPQPKVFNAPMAPTDIGYAQDIGYISDNFVSFTLNDFPGQAVAGTNTNAYYGVDFDPSATVLYALNDTDGTLGTIDLTTGAYTPMIACAAPSGSWTGLAIASDGTFYASDTTTLYMIEPATCAIATIGTFGGGTSLMIEIAINADGEMYGHDIATDSIYSIDTGTGAAALIGATGYDANFAQGMDFDFEDGMLYVFLYIGGGANVYGTVDLMTGAVTPLATDNPQGEFEGAIQVAAASTDIPWLSTDPITGTVAADSTYVVDVTFDTMTYTVGTYTGTLVVKTADLVNGMIDVPVTMTIVNPATYGVAMTPVTATQMTMPGSVVTYTLNVMNIGNTTQFFDLAASGNTWTVDLSDASVWINPGESMDVDVYVAVPAGAYDVSDEVIITVTSAGDVSAASTLTTVVLPTWIYLPLIYK